MKTIRIARICSKWTLLALLTLLSLNPRLLRADEGLKTLDFALNWPEPAVIVAEVWNDAGREMIYCADNGFDREVQLQACAWLITLPGESVHVRIAEVMVDFRYGLSGKP